MNNQVEAAFIRDGKKRKYHLRALYSIFNAETYALCKANEYTKEGSNLRNSNVA